MVCHNEERLPPTPSCLAYEAVNNKYHHPINMETVYSNFPDRMMDN